MVCRIVGLMDVVDQYELLEAVKEQKTRHERGHRPRGVQRLRMGELEDLGQQFKADDSQEHAGREAEYEMEPVAELEAEQSSGQGGDESGKRKRYQRS